MCLSQSHFAVAANPRKGLFGEDEMITRIESTEIANSIVNHPQFDALSRGHRAISRHDVLRYLQENEQRHYHCKDDGDVIRLILKSLHAAQATDTYDAALSVSRSEAKAAMIHDVESQIVALRREWLVSHFGADRTDGGRALTTDELTHLERQDLLGYVSLAK
jgi:hypothetical protein